MQYPYLKQHQLSVTKNPMPDMRKGHAETFPSGETGSVDWPTPEGSDVNRHRVEVYRPETFSPRDLAAEGLHIDPYANEIRNSLLPTLTPHQVKTLKRNAGDYEMSIKSGQSEQKAMENTVDSAMRGHAFNQDANLVNMGMEYGPEQTEILNRLKRYVETGNK